MVEPGLAGVVPPLAQPLPGSPALLLRPRDAPASVVVADLHLGLAATAEAPLGPPGGSAPELVDELLAVCRKANARRLIVAGDVKHPIVGVPIWLRPVVFDFFSALLAERLMVEVVLGNHDVGLTRHLPREVSVHPPTGWVGGGAGVFHGHRWPSSEVLAQRTLVAGHLHPGYRFAPTTSSPQGKRRCWVRVEFDRGSRVLGPDGERTTARQLIVLPAFHPLAGIESLNREAPERGRSFLYARFLGRGRARAYLLDGTDLGALPTSLPADRAGAVG